MNWTQEHILLQSGIDLTNCLVNCSNKGSCSYENRTIVCNCLANYTGTSCQKDLRPCSSFPCLNNGTCTDNVTAQTYTCACNSQLYYGDNCENRVNLCANVTCSGAGYCKKVNNQAVCSCNYGFSGANCSIVATKTKITKMVNWAATLIAILFMIFVYLYVLAMDADKFYRDFFKKTRK
jgi:hypothetical protein